MPRQNRDDPRSDQHETGAIAEPDRRGTESSRGLDDALVGGDPGARLLDREAAIDALDVPLGGVVRDVDHAITAI